METRHAAKVQALIDAVLDGPAEVDSVVRRAIADRVDTGAGLERAASAAVPDDLRSYVDLVAARPHEISDEDVAGLIRAGHSENAVFEVTVAAALGAGMARWERGLAVLREESE